MFQCAPPEVNGFGVTTSIPGFKRSSQVWMSSGFPLRTTKETTESVRMPLYSFCAPVRVDEARVDEPGDVAVECEVDDVGRQAGLDGPALLAGGAVGLLELDALALRGLLEGGNDRLVGLLRGRIGDERQLAASRVLVRRVTRPSASRRQKCNDDGENRSGSP